MFSQHKMIGYTCGSCWNTFEHFPGALMPCCPRCGNNHYVTRLASRKTYRLFLALPFACALAFGLWSRFSVPPRTQQPPTSSGPMTASPGETAKTSQ